MGVSAFPSRAAPHAPGCSGGAALMWLQQPPPSCLPPFLLPSLLPSFPPASAAAPRGARRWASRGHLSSSRLAPGRRAHGEEPGAHPHSPLPEIWDARKGGCTPLLGGCASCRARFAASSHARATLPPAVPQVCACPGAAGSDRLARCVRPPHKQRGHGFLPSPLVLQSEPGDRGQGAGTGCSSSPERSVLQHGAGCGLSWERGKK